MTRYRPPAAPKSPYITPQGMRALLSEQKALWLKRREVVAALSAAAAEGDRSENAEYIYRKKQLGGINYRIRYLQKRLPTLKVINQNPGNNQVRFGAWITVECDDGSTSEYRIVGADEIDHHEAYISVDAPVARALLGKYVDDEVDIKLENKAHTLVVLTIEYR